MIIDSTQSKIIVFSGPSGVGKDTIINHLIQYHGCESLVSYTTRPMRKEEVEGVRYKFVTPEEFSAIDQVDPMFVKSSFNGFLYGHPTSNVEQAILSKKKLIFNLRAETAIRLKSIISEAQLCFILPGSFSDLVVRLKKRGELDIPGRLVHAKQELLCLSEFDQIFINRESQIHEVIKELVDHLDLNG